MSLVAVRTNGGAVPLSQDIVINFKSTYLSGHRQPSQFLGDTSGWTGVKIMKFCP